MRTKVILNSSLNHNASRQFLLTKCTIESCPKKWLLMSQKRFATYVPEKDLKDSIMNENPVPLNIHKPHVLDDFLKELMEEQNKSYQINIEKMLERLQHKTVNIMGPLSRVSLSLDNTIYNKKRKVETTLEDLNKLVEQTVVLLGEAYNALTYQRRLKPGKRLWCPGIR